MTTLLQANNLTVQINNKVICHAVHLSIQAGEIWGILGPNGSGKTTLLHTLAGLHPLSDGQLTLHHQPLNTLSAQTIAQHIALLFQDITVTFAQTVWEYCLSGRYPHLPYFKTEQAKDRDITLRALQTMELEHVMHHPIHQLSGGEKRRAAIAAILVQTPDIYLLDEPTNHLDAKHQIQVLKHFSHLAKHESAAIIMSVHDINVAQQFCHHIVMLFDDGSLLHGKSEDVLTAANLNRLYRHPFISLAHHDQLFWHPQID